MGLSVYFQPDIKSGIVSSVGMALDTARSQGAPNVDFLCGVICHARSQSRMYGIPWDDVVNEIQGGLSQDDLVLLESVL